MSEPIVCEVDGEPHSARALQVANELAMRSGRRLDLMHITSAVGEPARRDRHERLLSTLRGDLGRTGLPLLMGTGAAAHELTCASRRAALLVLGTRGPSTLRQAARTRSPTIGAHRPLGDAAVKRGLRSPTEAYGPPPRISRSRP